MGELWEDLEVTQRARFTLSENVETLKASCAKEHDKTHFAECPECWPRIINAIRDRYLNCSTKEWFSGRRLFLQELDTLFSQALDQKIDITTIEKRIESEKHEWYRDKVKNIGVGAAAKNPDEARKLQALLNDKGKSVDELASELREALSNGSASNQAAFDTFMDRFREAKSPEEKTELYIDVLFQPAHDPQGAARSQKYVDMLRNGVALSDVINTMLRDRQSTKGAQDQKVTLQKQVEEFRRAKAAHEAAKTKKAKIKQDKADAAAAAQQQYKLPRCNNCGKAGDDQGYNACNYCLILSEVYHIPHRTPTLFCSDECWETGANKHDQEEHSCASGQYCIQLQDEEDIDMDKQTRPKGFCQECIYDHQVESIFCSIRCLDANFQRHREFVHIPKREGAGEVGEDEKDLEYAAEDKTRYRARKVEDHWLPLDDAVREFMEKTGARRKDGLDVKSA